MKTIHFTLLLTSAVLVSNASAGDKKELVPIQEAPQASRWSISTGVAISSIRTDFSIRTNPALLAGASPGGGTILYTGGANPEVYQDGSVGGQPNNGLANFTVNSASQTGTNPNNGFDTATFHGSTPYSLLGRAGTRGSDEETAFGPYLRLDYFLKDLGPVKLGLFGQYTFATAFNSLRGSALAARTDHTLTYDTVTLQGEVQIPGSFAVYDADAFNFGEGNAEAPRNVSTPSFAVANTSATLNVYLHTFTLGLTLTRDFGDRVHFVLSAGPTLNLFDTNLNTRTSWTTGGSASRSRHGFNVRWGAIVQAGVNIDLDSQKIYFFQANGDYHWVDKLSIRSQGASANIDASSWGVNVGFGRRF